MDINGTSCCALEELENISDMGSPEEILEEICGRAYEKDFYGFYDDEKVLKSSAFYVFTGVVGYRDGENLDVDYGPNLAKFIENHGLGVVVESPARYNRVNEPTHRVKVWVWAPSDRKLKAWWKDYKTKKEAERESKRKAREEQRNGNSLYF